MGEPKPAANTHMIVNKINKADNKTKLDTYVPTENLNDYITRRKGYYNLDEALKYDSDTYAS